MTELDDEEKNTMPKRCCDGWRRGRHRIHNTKDINGLWWCEQHTQKNWVCLVCPT
jgi:hypothetical protein